MSDDGRQALTVIAFIGSVFSPYYFKARQHRGGDASNHCAMNIALYGTDNKRWAFTEYAHEQVHARAHSLGIGRNLITWNGSVLTCHIDEVTAPVPSRLRGVIRLYPDSIPRFAVTLDSHALHRWQPLIPKGRIEVELDHPRLRWRGDGYMDTNDGAMPLDEAFRKWTWLRAHTRAGTIVLYDVTPTYAHPTLHSIQLLPSGAVEEFAAPPQIPLPDTGWGIERRARCDPGSHPSLVDTLENAPFYARSLLQTTLAGERLTAVHESLSLDRFRSPWVRSLLPFRMRRSRR